MGKEQFWQRRGGELTPVVMSSECSRDSCALSVCIPRLLQARLIDHDARQQAAPFLREIVQKEASSGSKELSAEQFTLAKEMEQRVRGAEIITIDGAASVSGAEGAYKPKVATWGVFPRPSNISREYGGGRTIRPGEVCHAVLAHVLVLTHQTVLSS